MSKLVALLLMYSWCHVDVYLKFQKFQILFSFLFSNKMLVFRAGIHKILVGLANREDPDQTAS